MSRLEYLRRQRWFARGDGPILQVRPLGWSREPEPRGFGVRIGGSLVDVRTPTGGLRTYQVPASYRREPFPGMAEALMDVEDGWHVYDALLDAHARGELLSGFAGDGPDDLRFEGEVPAPRTTVPLVAEQSNTSVVVDDRLLWKSFRIVAEGPNPDVEIGRFLAATGDRVVAPVRGWVRSGDVDLSMLYDYYPTATDGWQSARASVRDLMAEPDLAADHAGGDFAAQSQRLGATLAEVHRLLRPLGQEHVEPARLAERLRRRFAATSSAGVANLAERAERAFEELTDLTDAVPVQRVHGDLHLGQTLRTEQGWRIFDFEGEPATELGERRRPDSPLRDVAGMLRSLDYAPWSVAMQVGADPASWAPRAHQWTSRNAEALLRGYGARAHRTDFVLLRCYQVDKAAYEIDYELRHRPAWADIPRAALHRLLG